MAERGLLTENEASEIAQALWSEKYTSPDSLPTGTLLLDWAFLVLPEPESEDGATRVSVSSGFPATQVASKTACQVTER